MNLYTENYKTWEHRTIVWVTFDQKFPRCRCPIWGGIFSFVCKMQLFAIYPTTLLSLCSQVLLLACLRGEGGCNAIFKGREVFHKLGVH